MIKINPCFQKFPGDYLFTEIDRRISKRNNDSKHQRLIRLGIGDVTLPIPEVAANAMARAALDGAKSSGFHGYGPENGYEFLRKAIAESAYQARGIGITAEEIFVSDGAKSDCGGILDLFDHGGRLALCDPIYPAYQDAAAMAGWAGDYDLVSGKWTKLCYLPCGEDTGFLPELPAQTTDLVYLCSPNNPTGAAMTRPQLSKWVDWANQVGAVLLFDGAYEAFISSCEVPHSIYEIDGAKNCAIEFRSFSKTAGFTGIRCAYMVIPMQLYRDGQSIWSLWKRRLAARFNGVSYITQKGAETLCTAEGQAQIRSRIRYYQENAHRIKDELGHMGFHVFGGNDAPYLWIKTPYNMKSWDFFDLLLEECAIVSTPGIGFGPCGEGYLRLTAFASHEDTAEAVERIKRLF